MKMWHALMSIVMGAGSSGAVFDGDAEITSTRKRRGMPVFLYGQPRDVTWPHHRAGERARARRLKLRGQMRTMTRSR